MVGIKITTDSTCDLSEELIRELDLDIMRLYVSLGDKTYRDGKDIFPQDIVKTYEREGILPKTAAVSPEEYSELFEKYKDREAIIHFSISNKLSANFQNATIAKEGYKNVYLIDTLSLSTGIGLLILEADRLRKEGKSAEEIVRHVTELKPRVQVSFVVDTLEFLHKGGRCSSLAMIAGKILKIHPMLLVKNGAITVHKKFRGKMNQVLNEYVDALHAEFPNPRKDFAFITHCLCEDEEVEMVKQKVQSLYGFKNLYVTGAGATVSSHCGKGTLGLLFINDNEIK